MIEFLSSITIVFVAQFRLTRICQHNTDVKLNEIYLYFFNFLSVTVLRLEIKVTSR